MELTSFFESEDKIGIRIVASCRRKFSRVKDQHDSYLKLEIVRAWSQSNL
jgi:hypothetical protein